MNSPHVRESGIQQIFAVGIRNPEDWNPESIMVWNPESTMVWNLESGIHGANELYQLKVDLGMLNTVKNY